MKKQESKVQSFIKKVLKTNNEKGEIPDSSQETIPYIRILDDGVCQLSKTQYTKQIMFGNINFLLGNKEEQEIIYLKWGNLLNTLSPENSFQLNTINLKQQNFLKFSDDGAELSEELKEIRDEYSDYVNEQIQKTKLMKYIIFTFSVTTTSLKEAREKLRRIEITLLNQLKELSVSGKVLNGEERLSLLNHCLNSNQKRFNFDWDLVKKQGINTKDFICPDSFDFRRKSDLQVGNRRATTKFISLDTTLLTDKLIQDLIEFDNEIIFSIHYKTVPKIESIKKVKRKIVDLKSMKIDEQKKALTSGYDPDIIPTDLTSYEKSTEQILKDITENNERLFEICLLVTIFGKTLKELKQRIEEVDNIVQQHSCILRNLDFIQEQAFFSSLPMDYRKVDIKRALVTSGIGILIPFTVQELISTRKEATYYGTNSLTGSVILADKKDLMNPNSLILGMPGSGKSFSAKREIVDLFFRTKDDFLILDPEAEYLDITKKLNGTIINISSKSKQYINPLEINYNVLEDEDDEAPIRDKVRFLVSMLDLIIGNIEGLTSKVKGLISHCALRMYKEFKEKNEVPILQDFCDELEKSNDPDANDLITALSPFSEGANDLFGRHTNIDVSNRTICFNIRDIDDQTRPIAMFIIQEFIWNRVKENRYLKKITRLYMDEFHLFLNHPQTAEYSVSIFKRFRKWGGYPTGLTQNVKDLLQSSQIANILENSPFIYLLSQGYNDAKVLQEKLNLSDDFMKHCLTDTHGEGILVFGETAIPFRDKFPKNKMYKLITTKFEE